MAEHEGLVFLLSLATLLGVARIFGEFARTLGLPLVIGEIVAGIVLGPTALGKIAPRAQTWLFPSGNPQTMLAAYTTVAVVLLLVVAGIEVDLSIVRRRGRNALFTSVLGVVLPLGAGFAFGMALPSSSLPPGSPRVLFSLFVGVALSISALPVIAKTLLDLGLFKTDIGLLVMAAAMIDDLVGWLGFSILLGPMRGGTLDVGRVAATVTGTVAFVAVCLYVGRRVMDRTLARLETYPTTAPGRVLSLTILAALVGAAITQAIGVHAVFGGFIIGVIVGDSPKLTERTRVVIEDFVMNIFAPVFFASLGLRLDFAHAFDPVLCIVVFGIASITKVVGCTIGARIGGLNWREAGAVGFGLNARGAMEIILARLAHEAGLISDQWFVALVIMAVGTSLLSGPMMKRLLLAEPPEEDVVTLLRRGGFVSQLHASSAGEAIAELVRSLGSLLTGVKRTARDAVLERELTASTGMGDEVAIPHAAVEGLKEPMLALGLAPQGVDFNAPDGRPAKIVFLLLMPPKQYQDEVRILASIARTIFDQRARDALMKAETLDEVTRVLATNARRVTESLRPRAAAGDAGL